MASAGRHASYLQTDNHASTLSVNFLQARIHQMLFLTPNQQCQCFYWATVCRMVHPMLSDCCLSCVSVLSVCDVGVLWPNGWMDQGETRHGGRPWPRPHCVRWGPSSPHSPKGAQPPQFSAHVHCGQTAGWITMPLGMKVDLGPGDFVLDGDTAHSTLKRGHSPQFLGHTLPHCVKVVEDISKLSATEM